MSNFVASNYKFTDPVRYFKENDPYYWEVDNIPLKQLQENCLWLKDQLELSVLEEGISRGDFNELKPYSTGSDNLVRVKPGRFTARINDAYNKSPLQKLELITNTGIDSILNLEINTVFSRSKYKTSSTEYAEQLYTKLQDSATAGLNLNGLAERVLSWPYTANIGFNPVTFTDSIPSVSEGNWPILTGYPFYDSIVSTENAQALSIEFCRQFRGVARTAVVDIPEELTLEIPEFNSQEFFVVNSDGNPIYIPENELQYRIDLLFIYSKPIDTSSTYIQKYSGSTPTEITKPILGLLKGAGVGLQKKTTASQSTGPYNVNSVIGADGNNSMLPHNADSFSTTNGFQATSLNIHGSFPSPDDLLNLAPVISEKLGETDPQLVGQSILPVAYIVVRKNPTYSAGLPVINTTDVLDIRPFFRTTELTYNERAGIAAAIPSPSLANPVATNYVVETAIRNIKSYVDARFEPRLDLALRPLVLTGGVVQGGAQFGPEGILTQLNPTYDFGYTISTYPTWDLARWWEDPTVISRGALSAGAKGTQRSDWLDVIKARPNDYGDTLTPPQLETTGNNRLITFNLRGTVCRKTLRISKNLIPTGYTDLSISVNYKFCAPRAVTGQDDDRSTFQQFTGLYTERYEDTDSIYFIIYSLTSSPSYTPGGTELAAWSPRNSNRLNSYIVQTKDMPRVSEINDEDIPGPLGFSNLSCGGCTYPSVEFSILAYPSGYFLSETRSQSIDSSSPWNLTIPTA